MLSNNLQPLFFTTELGYRVPQDVGFASLDCTAEPARYAGIMQPRDRIAAKAVDMVVEQLENNEFGLPEVPKIVMVEGFWRDGPSLGPSRQASPSAGPAALPDQQ